MEIRTKGVTCFFSLGPFVLVLLTARYLSRWWVLCWSYLIFHKVMAHGMAHASRWRNWLVEVCMTFSRALTCSILFCSPVMTFAVLFPYRLSFAFLDVLWVCFISLFCKCES
jgi:hypothetical protein